jgi:predicted RNA-binding Zn-ribbon protein involved in translation (DUF1610 family)
MRRVGRPPAGLAMILRHYHDRACVRQVSDRKRRDEMSMGNVTPGLAQPLRKLNKKEKAQYLRKAKQLLEEGHDLTVAIERTQVADDYSIGPKIMTITATLDGRLAKGRKGSSMEPGITTPSALATQRLSFQEWIAKRRSLTRFRDEPGTVNKGRIPKHWCPMCGEKTISRVISSRGGPRFYWRQRRCESCKETYTTKEVVEPLNRPPDRRGRARNI